MWSTGRPTQRDRHSHNWPNTTPIELCGSLALLDLFWAKVAHWQRVRCTTSLRSGPVSDSDQCSLDYMSLEHRVEYLSEASTHIYRRSSDLFKEVHRNCFQLLFNFFVSQLMEDNHKSAGESVADLCDTVL